MEADLKREVAQVHVELFIEFAIGAAFILLRFFARWKVVGFAGWQIDDVLMGVALILYALFLALASLVITYGSIHGQTNETVYLLPPEMVRNITIGQKLIWIDWIAYIAYTWTLKATMLALLNRLTRALGWKNKIVKAAMVWTACSCVGALITHICVCLPVEHSWQVQPYPGDNCGPRTLSYPIIAAFNASSDLVIMLAPLPVIFSARVSPLRRLILIMLLCSGSLVMVAAILRAYYSLQTIRYMAIATGWSSRELFVAAIVTSMPGIKPLFSSSRWVTAKSQPYHQELVTVGGSGGSRQRGKSLPSRNNDDVSTEDLIVTKIDSGKMGKESQ